jgi:hypothetical protein
MVNLDSSMSGASVIECSAKGNLISKRGFTGVSKQKSVSNTSAQGGVPDEDNISQSRAAGER